MGDWRQIVGALAVVVLPLALAWWLLWRKEREPRHRRSQRRAKMPD